MGDVGGLLDHFFRHQYGRCVARLVRALGPGQLDLAETAVQEALARALKVWPTRGIPQDPVAWILCVARNFALDVYRRDSRAQIALEHPQQRAALEELQSWSPTTEVYFEGELADDHLSMIFMCCHPALSRQARVTLTLKVVSGFGVEEIARVFLTTKTTVAQRIVRARRHLRSLDNLALHIPQPDALVERLDSVIDVLYLMFNEGYSCHDTREVVRRDIADEALRLTCMLARHPACAQPRIHARAALMYFQSSRLNARVNAKGELLPLEEQDRGLWDQNRVRCGLRHLVHSAQREVVTELHTLAGIAACHATASSTQTTDWARLGKLYDELVCINGTFVHQLGRAVIHARLYGPERGLALVETLAKRHTHHDFHRIAAVRADCLRRMGRSAQAREPYLKAAQRAPSESERRFLQACAARMQPNIKVTQTPT